MKTEIKKINNLEELNKLEVGEVIQSSDNGKIVNLLYEGVDKNFPIFKKNQKKLNLLKGAN